MVLKTNLDPDQQKLVSEMTIKEYQPIKTKTLFFDYSTTDMEQRNRSMDAHNISSWDIARTQAYTAGVSQRLVQENGTRHKR